MRLELIEGKLSRSVPRGLGGSNPTWLLGGRLGNHRLYPEADAGFNAAVVARVRGRRGLARGVRRHDIARV